jgi:hypothetical protein
MPQSEYFKGHGNQVMGDMKKRYGDKAGERVFYATANKTGMKPGEPENKPAKPKRPSIGRRILRGSMSGNG